MKFLLIILKLCYLWSTTNGQFHPQTPCPGIFSYEGLEPEKDHWYGVILVSTDEALVGVRIDVRFDRPAQLLVSWMGEVTSSDNERFTILSLTQKLLPGPPLSSRFMIKYDPSRGSPQLRSIRLNGRQICPPDPNFPLGLQNRPLIPSEKPTRRPDPAFGPNINYNNPGHVPTESLDPVIFDHQTTTSTSYLYIDNTNQNKPTRVPQGPSNGYNEPELIDGSSNIRTTRRPSYDNNKEDSGNYNSGGGIIDDNKNHYTTQKYQKPPSSTTTESYNNRPIRPSQYGDNYDTNQDHKYVTTTKIPNSNTYNKPPSNTNNEGSYSTNQNTNSGSNNYYNDNKKPTKPTSSSSSSSSPSSSSFGSSSSSSSSFSGSSNSGSNSYNNNNSKNSNSNQRPTTTTEKNSYKKPTPRPQVTSTVHSNNQKVNPTKNSSGSSTNSFQYNNGRTSTTPRSQYHNSEEILEPSSSSNSYECGVVDGNLSSADSTGAIPLITNGQKTARGQWPWHIALYKIEGINLSYICGGTLVTLKFVITAAHCVTKKLLDRPVDPDTLVVYLGKYHLYQFSDDGGVQNKQVKDVKIYPGYNSSNYLGDIAILELSSIVEYTQYVRPCCLWRFNWSVIGEEGTVVGWGYDENDRVTEELKMAKMPVVSRRTCVDSYPEFFTRFTSNQTFCAGFRKGTTVCNGDSGGGMVFNHNSKWYLRGLVSITVAREGHRVCDTNHFVIFTDIAEFYNWLNQYVT